MEPRLFAEFQTFLQEAGQLKGAKVLSTPFVRRCCEEDLEPCLGPLRRASFRRLVEALLDNHCYIEAACGPPDSANSTSSGT